MNIMKALHDAVLEDAPEAATPAAVLKPLPPTAFVMPVQVPVPKFPAADDSGVYNILLARTDFASTALYQTIHKYLESMKAAPLDENTKLKIAFAQAAQLDHITPDMVRQAFSTLKQSLAAERDKFSSTIQGKNATIQSTRQTADTLIGQIAAKQHEIETLTTQRTNLLASVEVETQHVTGLAAQFDSAASRREQELDKQLADMEAVIK